MPSFLPRSFQPELIDGEEFTNEELVTSYHEIEWVNRFLGGTRTLTSHLFPLLSGKNPPLQLADVGCGSADIPLQVLQWSRKMGIPVRLILVDRNFHILRIVKERFAGFAGVLVAQADANRLPFKPGSIHILTASLLLHHFPTAQAVQLLRHFQEISREAILINDLIRGWIPYLSISLLSTLFSRSRLVRNDAPLSVRRGFSPGEVRALAVAAGATRWKFSRHFPYRFCLLIEFEESRK
ncbi:MAG: methyltransferase domain-containing protein [Candidatus Tectomicrobia bacterium]|uniref:Methyltransferase domain-containing protein n=1 Tax=Tectimicrobiota bacterium TaxID=2528274 RepID=A0A932GPZ2_UNCTE|nr:methyltransferase domain-containing protein [Candidatus Tectomicrobia bacterium]